LKVLATNVVLLDRTLEFYGLNRPEFVGGSNS